MVRVCLTACVYRRTSEYSGQYLYKGHVYHVKQSTSLNDIRVQSLAELRVIWVVAAQTWGSRLESHMFSFRFVGDIEKLGKHDRSKSGTQKFTNLESLR